MQGHLLTPDISATIEVDLVRLKLETDLEIVRGLDGQDDAKARAEAEILSALSAHAGGPVATIGYIPAAKMTELRHRVYALRERGDVMGSEESMEAGAEITREWVRWGVRGHTLPVPFDVVSVEFRGSPHTLAGPGAMDCYERNGLLYALRQVIEKYNTLSPEKKMLSSSNAGTAPETSDATSAIKSPACESGRDA